MYLNSGNNKIEVNLQFQVKCESAVNIFFEGCTQLMVKF